MTLLRNAAVSLPGSLLRLEAHEKPAPAEAGAGL